MLLALGAGVLLGSHPALAMSQPPPGGPEGDAASAEQAALGLLGAAVSAARGRTYSGTAYLASYREGRAASAMVRLRHVPGLGLDAATEQTAAASGAGSDGSGDDLAQAARTDVLDERVVELLAQHYDLAVSGSDGCAGRSASVVEARRPGAVSEQAAVAGRFWIDRDSGLVLRREVYDDQGRTVRSSAYVDLRVDASTVAVRHVPTTPGDPVAPDALADWPASLPGSFALVDARSRPVEADGRESDVVHLAYSDGLSTLSLFAQDGRLDGAPGDGFAQQQVEGRSVWVRGSTPQRVVWSGGGRTWTLLSDAPDGSVRAVVASLPHDDQPDTGVLARASRGAARIGSWLNPFS